MAKIGTGRYGTFLNRFLRTGSVEIGGEVVPDLFPVFDIHSRPEMLFLQGERLCSARVIRVGVAAQRSCVRLVNPAGSGSIIVMEAIRAETGLADTMTMGTIVSTYVPNSTSVARALDMRWEGLGCAGTLDGGVVTGLSALHEFSFEGQHTVLGFFILDVPIIIPPGQAIFAQNGADNVSITASVFWRERQVLPEEL